MSGKTYIGVNNIARNPKKIYAGVNGIAREVKSAYIGVNGIAKQIWSSSGGGGGDLPTGYYPVRYVYCDSRNSSSYLYLDSFTKNTRIICMCSSALSSDYGYKVGILAGGSGSSFDFNFLSNTNGHILSCQYGTSYSTHYTPDGETQNGDVPISKRYVIDINRDTSYGTYLRYGTGSYNLLFNNTVASGPLGNNIILNYDNYSGNDGRGTKYYYIEIYANIWTSTSPAMQLYPCMHDDNGTMVAGLYDVVNQIFYGNAYWENGPRISNYDISL